MDQIKEFLTRRNIIALVILAVLAVGLLVGVRLVQQQTQLKSKAAQPTYGSISVTKSSIDFVGGNWESVPVAVKISVPGANDTKTVAGVFVTKTENISAGVGWTAVGKYYGSNGSDSFDYSPPSNFEPGSYTFGLFLMDQNTVLDVIQTSSSVKFNEVGPVPVSVSGKVTNKVTGEGVQVTINQDRTNECNIGTKQQILPPEFILLTM